MAPPVRTAYLKLCRFPGMPASASMAMAGAHRTNPPGDIDASDDQCASRAGAAPRPERGNECDRMF